MLTSKSRSPYQGKDTHCKPHAMYCLYIPLLAFKFHSRRHISSYIMASEYRLPSAAAFEAMSKHVRKCANAAVYVQTYQHAQTVQTDALTQLVSPALPLPLRLREHMCGTLQPSAPYPAVFCFSKPSLLHRLLRQLRWKLLFVCPVSKGKYMYANTQMLVLPSPQAATAENLICRPMGMGI